MSGCTLANEKCFNNLLHVNYIANIRNSLLLLLFRRSVAMRGHHRRDDRWKKIDYSSLGGSEGAGQSLPHDQVKCRVKSARLYYSADRDEQPE